MALLGNRSIVHNSPGRFLNGFGTAGGGIASMRSAFNKHGMMRNAYEQFDAKSAIPLGHLSPSAWVLPKTAGGMSSRNVTTLTADAAGLAVGGVTSPGEASFTIDFSPAAGSLIASGTGSSAFSITALPLLLTASLGGIGAASFTITANNAQLGALASGYGATTISLLATNSQVLPLSDASPLRTGLASLVFSGSLVPYAIGSMAGSTEGGGVLSEASILAAMNANPPKVNIAKVNDVVVTGTGAPGSEWGP